MTRSAAAFNMYPLSDSEPALLIHIHLLLIPILLATSAFFAAAEAALFSLNRTQLEVLRQSRPSVFHKIRSLIYRPDELLTTIVIGNEFLNIMLGTLVTSLLLLYFPNNDLVTQILLSVLVSSVLLLTCSEILPKIVAFRMPVLVASFLVYPMTWAHFMFTPFRRIFMGMSQRILAFAGIQVEPPSAVNEKDFLTLLEVGEESGTVDREEKQLIHNVFHFSDLSVQAVMTPWSKVFGLPESLTPGQLIAKVKEKPFSRIPIVTKAGDGIRGILYTKGLLPLLLHHSEAEAMEVIQRATFPPYIVSSHKKISKLFREFKLKKVHMALVVDEYGKQLGIVTLEDILGALFRTQQRKIEAP